jgi:lysophospholipase L1-like esterase
MAIPHPLYGYVLKPGFESEHLYVNAQGFAQRDLVPLGRSPGVVRLAAMGESTTHGHIDVDKGCYPTYLRQMIAESGRGYRGVEVINAGVAGWLSDQVALRAEHEIAAYRPDVVVLYVGWNDFQIYDPYLGAPPLSGFQTHFQGSRWHAQAVYQFKSVALLAAAYQKYCCHDTAAQAPSPSLDTPLEDLYRFYLQNLDRIVKAYRQANPQVHVALCTLVGEWPYGTQEEYATRGRVGWMILHEVTKEAAAEHLRRFNGVIRKYAAEHDLLLIDAAAAFEELDRSRLHIDFAHLTFEGYELLAEVMVEALRQAQVIQAHERPRRAELLTKYRRGTSAGTVVSSAATGR